MYRIRDWLYIGDATDAANREQLRQQGIGALLQLASDAHHPGLTVKTLHVPDAETQDMQHLADGIAFIRQQKAAGKTVLVTCHAGISRSTTYALGALKAEEGGTLLDRLRDIKQHHPRALPHIRLWHSLNTYYGENTPYQAIWRRE